MKTMTQRKDPNGKTDGMIVKRVSVPIGLEELMESLSKEVILKKPKDLYLFASEYFARLVNLREKSNTYKAHPVHTVQSATKLRNLDIAPSKKISPTRPIKHLSRQLSVRGKSPVQHRPTQTESTAKKITLRSRERKTSTDRKDSETRGVAKAVSSKDLTNALNSQGTSTGTSSLQSTPREKRQSSVARKVKSSVSDDQNKTREDNKKPNKVQKRSKSEQVKTALVTPTVIGGTTVAASTAAAVVDTNIIKGNKKRQIGDSDVLAGNTGISLTAEKTESTDLKQDESKQAKTDNFIKVENNQASDHRKISSESTLDSDILAKSTNISEVAKTIHHNEETLKSIDQTQKIIVPDTLLGNENEISKLSTTESKDEKLEKEKNAVNGQDEQVNKNHEDEKGNDNGMQKSSKLTTKNSENIYNASAENITQLTVEDKADQENIQNHIDNFSTKYVGVEEHSEDVAELTQITDGKTDIEKPTSDGKSSYVSKGDNDLDKRNEPSSEEKLDEEDVNVKLSEKKNEISSMMSMNNIIIDKNDAQTVKENLENMSSETNESISNENNLDKVDNLVLEQRPGTDKIVTQIKNSSESDDKMYTENPDSLTAKAIETQDDILPLDNLDKDKSKPESNGNEIKVSEAADGSRTSEDNTLVKSVSKAEPIISERQGVVSDSKLELYANADTTTSASGAPEDEPAMVLKTHDANKNEQNKLQEDSNLISQTGGETEDEEKKENEKTVIVKTLEQFPDSSMDKESKDSAVLQLEENEHAAHKNEIEENITKKHQDDFIELINPLTKEDIKDNAVTIKMEEGKSDDILVVSISDKQGIDTKDSKRDERDKTIEILNNSDSTDDKKQNENKFFRENEELVSQEDDKTKINLENSGSEQQEQKISESIEKSLDDKSTKMETLHVDAPTTPSKDDTVTSNLEVEQEKYTSKIDQKSYEENENVEVLRNNVTQKIIDNEISKNQAGIIDSPVKQFLNEFINNEQVHVLKSPKPVSSENGENVENKNEDILTEEYNGTKENNKIHTTEEKEIIEDISLDGDKNSKNEGNNLIFNSVKDLLDYDNVNKLGSNKINQESLELKDEKNIQREHKEDSAERLESDHSQTSTTMDETHRNKRSTTGNEEAQHSKTEDTVKDQHLTMTTTSNLQDKKDSEPISKEFDSVRDDTTNHIEQEAEKHMSMLENVLTDNQAKTETENLETHHEISTVMNQKDITDKTISDTQTILQDTKTVESKPTNDKLEQMHEGQHSAINKGNCIISPEQPILADKKTEIIDQINNEKAVELKLKPEALSRTETLSDIIHTEESENKHSDLNKQHSEETLKENLLVSDIKKAEIDNHVNKNDLNEAKSSTDVKDTDTEIKVKTNVSDTKNVLKEIENRDDVMGKTQIYEDHITNTLEENAKISEANKIIQEPTISEEKSRLQSTNAVEISQENRSLKQDNSEELKLAELSQLASVINIIQNIIKSKLSARKPGVLDRSVSQYLNSFLVNEQSSVFRQEPINPSEGANHENTKLQEKATLKNTKELLPDKDTPTTDSAEYKSTKSEMIEPFLSKKDRSLSQENLLTNGEKLPESVTNNSKMRRVRSVGHIKQDENEYKSKIPLSARRSAGRRPLLRQQEKDSKDIEEKLIIKKELNRLSQGISPRSSEEDEKIVSQSSENVDRTKKLSEELEIDKIKENEKELFIEKDKAKEIAKKDGITKEDVIIAKTILKGIEGAEKHIGLIEEKIGSDSKNNLEAESKNQIKSDNDNNKELVEKDSKVHDVVTDNHKENFADKETAPRKDVVEKSRINKEEVERDSRINVTSGTTGKETTFDMDKCIESATKEINENQPEKIESELIKKSEESSIGDIAGIKAEEEKDMSIGRDIDKTAKSTDTSDSKVSVEGALENNDSKHGDLIRVVIAEKKLHHEVIQELEKVDEPVEGVRTENVTKAETGMLNETGTNKAVESFVSSSLDTAQHDSSDSKNLVSVPVETVTENIDPKHLEVERVVEPEQGISIKNVANDKADVAATTIQKTWRGFHERKDLGQKIKTDNNMLERAKKEDLLGLDLKEHSEAAVKIQSLWRGYIIRKNMENSRKQSEQIKVDKEKAILKIQATVRGYLERLKYKKLKGTKITENIGNLETVNENMTNLKETSDDNNSKEYATETENKEIKESDEHLSESKSISGDGLDHSKENVTLAKEQEQIIRDKDEKTLEESTNANLKEHTLEGQGDTLKKKSSGDQVPSSDSGILNNLNIEKGNTDQISMKHKDPDRVLNNNIIPESALNIQTKGGTVENTMKIEILPEKQTQKVEDQNHDNDLDDKGLKENMMEEKGNDQEKSCSNNLSNSVTQDDTKKENYNELEKRLDKNLDNEKERGANDLKNVNDDKKDDLSIKQTEFPEIVQDGNDDNRQIKGAVTEAYKGKISSDEKEEQFEKSLFENSKDESLVDIDESNNLSIIESKDKETEITKHEEGIQNNLSENVSSTESDKKQEHASENTSEEIKKDKELSSDKIADLKEITDQNRRDLNIKDKDESGEQNKSRFSSKTDHDKIIDEDESKLNSTQDISNENKSVTNDFDVKNSVINNGITNKDKPDFYRSDTVLEPNMVKKAVPDLTDGGAHIEIKHSTGETVLSEKDANNNTQSKDETTLEGEVRSAVNKILKGNNKAASSLEVEIEETVKNIMKNEDTAVDMLPKVPSYEISEHLSENMNITYELNKTRNDLEQRVEHISSEKSIPELPSTDIKDQPVTDLSKNTNNLILSETPSNENNLSEKDIVSKNLKNNQDPSSPEINTDDVSSVDSVDSVITVVPNVNYDTSAKKEINSNELSESNGLSSKSLSLDVTKEKDNKEISKVKKSLSTDALEGHVELIDQVQKTLLDQISGKSVDTASKFDIEQLRKELHEAASLYKGEDEDMRLTAHDDELLEYLNDFEPEDDTSYDSRRIRTPVRELPDIEEEVDSSDTEITKKAALERSADKEPLKFCETPSTISSQKLIDNKPLSDHVEILNLDKFKQGHNEIIIKDDNIQINGTETDGAGKNTVEDSNRKLLHSSELHDSVVIPMSSSSAKRRALVHSGKLKHTSEFHDTLLVPLPSGSDVNIKNEAKEMLENDKPIEPTRIETVDTGNQTALQQSPAGAPVVTSRRSSQDGVDVVEAQASLRDTSPAKPKSVESFTHRHQSPLQSPRFVEQEMESENNNNKRNNAINKSSISSPEKNMEAQAATKIQAGFRGYQVRKQLKTKAAHEDRSLSTMYRGCIGEIRLTSRAGNIRTDFISPLRGCVDVWGGTISVEEEILYHLPCLSTQRMALMTKLATTEVSLKEKALDGKP